MEEEVKEEKKVVNKKVNIRFILVTLILILFLLITFISSKAEYLKIKEIDEKYTSIFFTNFYMKCEVFGVIFLLTYFVFYINNKIIKKGLKHFFEEEKKDIPKLPNKSISLIFGIIAGSFALKFLYTKYIVCANAASFGTADPIFNMDIGFYMFVLPFIKTVLLFGVVLALVVVAYTAIYYVIAINVCFDKGIDMDSLKTNTFIKQIKFWAIIFSILIGGYLLIAAQDILTGDMLNIKDSNNTSLTGAGLADTFIKLWGYRLFSVIVFISVINIIRNASVEKFRKCIASASVIPLYLVVMFGILIYFQEIYVGSSELDKQKEYIKYNIDATKEAYNIEIEPKIINNYGAINQTTLEENIDVINNIPIFNEEIINKTIVDMQDNSTYYSYDRSNLGIYNRGFSKKLVSITPREIIDDSNRSYNNKTYEYTHGYSVVVSDPNLVDKNGYVTMLQSDLKSNNSDIISIDEPRIYFGLETDSEIIVNSDYGSEFDYPVTTTTYEENIYDGNAGLSLNFFDRLILGINTGNYKIAFSKYLNEDSKIIINRNILDRVKLLLPYIEYDEKPYLVVTEEGDLVWVIDGYTESNKYPYSQITTITKQNGNKEKINYIRNSVKVLINSYTGETKFYITDRNDPIIMMYRNLYPDLFVDLEEDLPESIKANLLYPQYLFDIQANVIKKYHDISEDVLYRADDVWNLATDGENAIGSKYTMLRTIGMNESKLGLVATYTKEGKESLNSYLVGYYDSNPKLGLYKFSSDNSIIGVAQLNSLIEEDETIWENLKSLDVSGVKMVRDVIIVPIVDTLLYVEPVYQVRLNELETQVLKKVIVSSGNKVAIGDNLENAIKNLLSEEDSIKLEYIDMEDIDQVIDSIIEAKENLQDSIDSGNLEMVGKDISTLQLLIEQLEVLRKEEIKNGGKVR